MNLGKQMLERLRLLAKEGPEAAHLQLATNDDKIMQFTLHDGPQYAKLELFDHDRYSVTLRALEVGLGEQPKDVDVRAYLSAHAAEIVRQLDYLEEPLAVWELDNREDLAQLRSSPPYREEADVSYWEVTLWAGAAPGAKIMRYRWNPTMTEREVVDYPATFALVARMTDALKVALTSVE